MSWKLIHFFALKYEDNQIIVNISKETAYLDDEDKPVKPLPTLPV